MGREFVETYTEFTYSTERTRAMMVQMITETNGGVLFVAVRRSAAAARVPMSLLRDDRDLTFFSRGRSVAQNEGKE